MPILFINRHKFQSQNLNRKIRKANRSGKCVACADQPLITRNEI